MKRNEKRRKIKSFEFRENYQVECWMDLCIESVAETSEYTIKEYPFTYFHFLHQFQFEFVAMISGLMPTNNEFRAIWSS